MHPNRPNDIGYLLKHIDDKLKLAADESLKGSGITFSQVRVIAFITMNGGKATQKEIKEYFDVAHTTVLGMVKRLEKNGFLESYQDPEDRRNRILVATKKAKRLDSIMQESMIANEKRLVQGLNDEEIKELRRMLLILKDNIDK